MLLAIFIVSALVVWIAGVQLSKSTDALDDRFGFGEAMGGLLFLAIATNLPEIAITASAAATRSIGIATGNILGGIAVQTLVLVLLDAFVLGGKAALTSMTTSLDLILQAVVVLAVLMVAIMGTQFPAWLVVGRVEPAALIIVALWGIGLWLSKLARKDLPWYLQEQKSTGAHDSSSARKQKKTEKSIPLVIAIFALASLATLIAGAALEMSGDTISNKFGLNSVIFGATFLAIATSLPEISTGYESIKLGDYEMAMSDIFGGNAFLPVLFLLAGLISGKAVLPQAQKSDIYLAGLGCLLTIVYICGLLFHSRRQVFQRLGIDSLVVFVFYLLGTAGVILIVLK